MNRIYLCLAHMSETGEELKYIKEAFDQNWVVPLGPNVDAFEKELEKFDRRICRESGLYRGYGQCIHRYKRDNLMQHTHWK